MSILTTEYAVRRVRRGVCQSQHGPYDTMEQAVQQKEGGERIGTKGIDHWVIMERDVTAWESVPETEPPTWPEED